MKGSNTIILAASDDGDMRQFISPTLRELGEVIYADDREEALEKIANLNIDVIIADIDMPELDGTGLLRILKQERQITTPVIIITSRGINGLTPVQSAVHCTKLGAFDYLDKRDIKLEKFREIVEQALESRVPLRIVTDSSLGLDITAPRGSKKIIGVSKQLEEVFQKIMKLASTNVNVLIQGEAGTGKEIVAQAIHYANRKRQGPFVPLNCDAIPEEALESELFGSEVDISTGALKAKRGKLELANGGTLFLDEVAEMSLDAQAKLLRALQERVIEKTNELEFIPLDVRIIAATTQNLEEAINDGTFRQDLYYRLNVVSIHIPPLRERKDDIPPLIDYILRQERQTQGIKEKITLTPQAMHALINYDWPGNVRELENVIARSLALRTGTVLDIDNLSLPQRDLDFKEQLQKMSLKDAAQRAEYTRILEVLQETNWNKTKAAEILDITNRTLRYKLKDYNISPLDVDNLSLPQLNSGAKDERQGMSLKDAAQQAEYIRILEVLKETNWNKNKAAKILDITNRTLDYKLKDYNISHADSTSPNEN